MNSKNPKILMLVEGAKTDVKLMKHLLDMYGISETHEIVSYNTNIYTLYKEMFVDNEPESIDLLQLLKSRETDESKKALFNESYSDILLIFDLDPQDGEFSAEKIMEMQNYFTESSDMGKLYLNYPMVEAFYHMKDIPDEEYNDRTVELQELLDKSYKTRVNRENRNRNYTKFAVTREECDIVIKQNIGKGRVIAKVSDNIIVPNSNVLDSKVILKNQLDYMEQNQKLYVLCTCVYYIWHYNSGLLGNA